MTQVQQDGRYNLTKPVILAHPHLHEARAFGKKGKETGEPKYSGNFVFDSDHPDLKELKVKAAAVARARWPGRDFKELKFPFVDGTKVADKRQAKSNKNDADYARGKVVIAARSKYEPRLAAILNGKIVDLEGDARIKEKGKFFFGAECFASFNFVPYDGIGENPDGVTAYLDMVLVTGKGERIAGGASAAERFKGYAGAYTAEDPTDGAGMDDDDKIPF
jgi:Protein of unknown function (DUF2815)